MKKGDLITDLEIIDIASNGKAVGKLEGQVVFINGLIPGDVADVQVFKKRRKYAEGRSVELKKESEDRTSPRCVHFGTCGGCKWQNMNYTAQLRYKESHVRENLKKISGVELPEMNPILPSEEQYDYRNKLEYTFSNKRWLTQEEIDSGQEFDARHALGFHVPGMFDKVVDLSECHLQGKISNEVRDFIRRKSLELDIPFFDLREQNGALRNLIVRTTTTGEVMVILSVFEMTDDVKSLLEAIRKEFPDLTSLQYAVNAKKNDTLFDQDIIPHSGQTFITEKMKGLSYRIGPKTFYQTNSRQAEKLYEVAMHMADLKGDELVYDLYTGTGTIANYLAKKSKKVVGVEYVPEAVADAKVNSELNGIENTEFFAGDMKDILTDDFFEMHGRPEVIVTDPPRAGMHPDVVERIAASGAGKVVYVSCNSASQARDLEVLNKTYKVVEIQPVDMFPQTAHVENVVKMIKR
ncbi:MAG: 23S rRNA (uracil(1939)-C(5))-methyltransferase RlmD [Vicingaceae bacterium]